MRLEESDQKINVHKSVNCFNFSELYQEEWWTQLKFHNKQSYKERHLKNVTPWYILTPQVVQLIFLMSDMLHQPPEVRYLTVEILDR
jgi:hypothetical protein